MALSTEANRAQLNCERHGVYMAYLVGPRSRLFWTRCDDCRVEENEAIRQRQLAADLEEKYRARLSFADIPARFSGKSLETFNAETEGQRYALTVARDYVETFPQRLKKGEGLILSGMPGTGKSHIALAILMEALRRTHGRYVTCMGAIREVRGTWRKDSEHSEADVLDVFGGTGLLVLDEIGVQYGTDGEQTIIFDILDRRYRDVLPTILLTNQDKAGFKQFIGERAYDRLTETCRWVPFDWQSYRATARKEAQA